MSTRGKNICVFITLALEGGRQTSVLANCAAYRVTDTLHLRDFEPKTFWHCFWWVAVRLSDANIACNASNIHYAASGNVQTPACTLCALMFA